MPINEYGFLGKDIKQYKNKLETKHKDVFDFYEELNHYLNAIEFKIVEKSDGFSANTIIEVEKHDSQGGTIYAIFLKSLTTFQSIYFLFKHYFCNNAENLCRILFEEMVNIYYCSLDEDKTKIYLAEEEINEYYKNEILYKIMNKQKGKKIKYFPNNDLESYFKEKSYDERKKLIINKLKIYNVKDIFTEKGKPKPFNLKRRIEQIIGQRKDLESITHYYCTFYKIASLGIHSSPSMLDKYWIFDKCAGGIKDFRQGPKAENCEIYCIIASIHFMILIIECVFGYFKYPKKEDVSQFWETTKKIGSKYQYFENIK
jgi:hypothetical protein